MTGQNTKYKTRNSDYKHIYYYWGGKRNSNSYDSWKEAEMVISFELTTQSHQPTTKTTTLVATGEYFNVIKLCKETFCESFMKIKLGSKTVLDSGCASQICNYSLLFIAFSVIKVPIKDKNFLTSIITD